MGVDMNFFVKIKKDDKYIDLPLYNREGEPVSITYCGWALFDEFRMVFRKTSFEKMKEYVDHYYRDENEEYKDEEYKDDDYIGIEAYETSFIYLMYLVEKAKVNRGNEPVSFPSDEDDDEDRIDMNRFYSEIVNSVNVMLNLADEDYIFPDDVKIVMLASY